MLKASRLRAGCGDVANTPGMLHPGHPPVSAVDLIGAAYQRYNFSSTAAASASVNGMAWL